MNIFEKKESQVRGYSRNFPKVFSQARGSSLFDENDNKYIDFLSGAGSLNYGHNNKYIKEDVIEYLKNDGVLHGLDMMTEAKERFIRAFDKYILQPRGMEYKMQFTGPTGTNAVEAALKIARKVTKRHNIVSFTNAFHGVTRGSLAATANQHYRKAAGLPLDQVSFMPYDNYLGNDYDSLDYFEKTLLDPSSGLDKPAAVIVETIQGEGGVNVASFKWLRKLSKICKAHEVLLIVDDIQVGCGRTGSFFSFETAQIEPDIITLSKSLSAYGLPMSIVLLKESLDIWKPGEHNGTFRGNNLAFVSAASAIHHYWSDKDFSKEILEKAKKVKTHLSGIVDDNDLISECRGRGLIQALVFKNPEDAAATRELCFKKGLIIETSGPNDEVLKLLPPLTIEDSELDKGLNIIEEAVEEVTKTNNGRSKNDCKIAR